MASRTPANSPRNSKTPAQQGFKGLSSFYHFRRLCFDDGHARIAQALAERRAHRVVRAADDEVDDLDGYEDDTQALTHA